MIHEFENYLSALLKDHSWKSPAILGGICLFLLILLDSVLFIVVLALIKLALIILAVALLCRAAYLAYPTVMKKLKERG